MRNIPPDALTLITQKKGIEPINIIRVFWTEEGFIDYADREFPNVHGKLLTLSDIEDVINLDNNSSSTTVNIKFDDSDGSLKEIFDNVDIHRRYVQIFQWFTELPYTSKFVIFEGEIASPINWNESDRTLTFDVLSKLEEREVGFSADEAEFNYVPPDIIGKSWPLVFGTVIDIPAVQVNKAPLTLSAEEIGALDPRTHGLVTAAQSKNANLLRDQSVNYWLLAISAYNTQQKYQDLQVFARQDGLNTDYSSLIEQYGKLGDDYVKQSNDLLREYYTVLTQSAEEAFAARERLRVEKSQIAVANAAAFAQKTVGFYQIDGQTYKGFFDQNLFHIVEAPQTSTSDYIPAGITEVTDAPTFTRYTTQLPPGTFTYAQGGSTIRVGEDYPLTYIACLGFGTVLSVSAYLNGILTGVPPKYYGVIQRESNGLKWTAIVMNKPLSSIVPTRLPGSNLVLGAVPLIWADDIFVTIQSEIGTSMIDVLKYLITTYSRYTWDDVSFDSVKVDTDPYPLNFVVPGQPDVFKLMKDIAYQCRCAIWFSDLKFFIKYLPAENIPIETIVQDDVDLGSVDITFTSTEEIVTKYIATWKPKQSQDSSKIIFRNNIQKYGTLSRTYDYFVFNDERLVAKSAEFWMIRMSNTWKRLTFRTFLTKLKIETWDTITITGLFVANTSVNCIVESSKYDSATGKLIISCWVPVRAGEMTQYPFAYPKDLPIEMIYPVFNDPNAGIIAPPLANGDIYPQSNVLGVGTPLKSRANQDKGRGVPSTDSYDNGFDYSVNVQLDSREIVAGSPPILGALTLKQYNLKPLITPDFKTQENNGIHFGFVQDQIQGKQYNVLVYMKGFSADPTSLVCEQFAINDTDVIPKGTPVMVVQTTETVIQANGSSVYNTKYIMQVPIWVKPNPPTV